MNITALITAFGFGEIVTAIIQGWIAGRAENSKNFSGEERMLYRIVRCVSSSGSRK